MIGTATPARREGAFGVERIAAGTYGKAVRLADVVRWLMKKWQTVRVDAVANHLVPKLKGEAPQLYLLQQGGFARAADEIEWFATRSGGAPARRVFSAGLELDGRPRAPSRSQTAESLGKGIAGAVQWIQLAWSDSRYADTTLDDEEAIAAYLAVSEADARAYWGWPSTEVSRAEAPATNVTALRIVAPLEDPKTFSELVKFRQANPQAEWSAEHKGILAREADDRSRSLGASGVRKGMADELGISVSRLNDLIRTADQSGKREAKRQQGKRK